MTGRHIIQQRLINHQIVGTAFTKPTDIVSWYAAMQSQEYAMAKWAIGMRLPDCSNDVIEEAFNKGEILRTHVLRPTWHFVTPEDIRWMLALSGPRVHAVNAYYYRQRGLDEKIFRRCHKVLIKALQGGKHLTRAALQEELAKAKIIADKEKLGTIMMHAELEGIICSGPRVGKQFTYALLEERVPSAKTMPRDESLALLTKKYFTSRGPATLHDFVWWSGLTMKDARKGVDMLGKTLVHETFNNQDYISTGDVNKNNTAVENKPAASFLMPDYDEYGIGYKDRSAFVPDAATGNENPIFNRIIIANGQMIGSWRPTISKNKVQVETSFVVPVSKAKQQAVQRAVRRYKAFVEG